MTPYITVEDADTYFTTRYNVAAWESANDTDKLKALSEATRRIDRLNFLGIMAGDSPEDNQFPRYGDETVPNDIKYACAEIAFALLDGIDPERELELLSMKSQGFASARSSYDRSFVPEHFLAGIPSALAWQYLKPYLYDTQSVDMVRVG